MSQLLCVAKSVGKTSSFILGGEDASELCVACSLYTWLPLQSIMEGVGGGKAHVCNSAASLASQKNKSTANVFLAFSWWKNPKGKNVSGERELKKQHDRDRPGGENFNSITTQ